MFSRKLMAETRRPIVCDIVQLDVRVLHITQHRQRTIRRRRKQIVVYEDNTVITTKQRKEMKVVFKNVVREGGELDLKVNVSKPKIMI